MANEMQDWYTTGEAAKYLNLSRVSIKAYCDKGTISCIVKGRTRLIHRDELDRYQVEGRKRGRPRKLVVTKPARAAHDICLECGSPLAPQSPEQGGSPQVYCSDKCQKKAQNRRNYERRKAR